MAHHRDCSPSTNSIEWKIYVEPPPLLSCLFILVIGFLITKKFTFEIFFFILGGTLVEFDFGAMNKRRNLRWQNGGRYIRTITEHNDLRVMLRGGDRAQHRIVFFVILMRMLLFWLLLILLFVLVFILKQRKILLLQCSSMVLLFLILYYIHLHQFIDAGWCLEQTDLQLGTFSL